MLILTRRIGEKLVITTASGERIEVSPIGRSGGQIKLGVEADRSIVVDREEIDKRKVREAS